MKNPLSSVTVEDQCFLLGHVDQWGVAPMMNAVCVRCGRVC